MKCPCQDLLRKCRSTSEAETIGKYSWVSQELPLQRAQDGLRYEAHHIAKDAVRKAHRILRHSSFTEGRCANARDRGVFIILNMQKEISIMNLPQFNAEASLGPTMGIYRGKVGFGKSGMVEISTINAFLASSTPRLNSVFLRWQWPQLCCFDPGTKTYACIPWRPGQVCNCQNGHPKCEDPIFTQF